MKLKGLLVLSWLILSCTESSFIDRDFLVLFSADGVERTVYDFESSYVAHLISTGKNDSYDEREAHLAKMIDDILLANSGINKGFVFEIGRLSGLLTSTSRKLLNLNEPIGLFLTAPPSSIGDPIESPTHILPSVLLENNSPSLKSPMKGSSPTTFDVKI